MKRNRLWLWVGGLAGVLAVVAGATLGSTWRGHTNAEPPAAAASQDVPVTTLQVTSRPLARFVEVVGTLDRIEKVTQFTSFTVRARLQVPEDGREDQAQRLLEKAERGCLITNSLKAATHLEAQIDVATPQ